MEELEQNEDEGKEFIRVRKIPLEDLLNILENLYEIGTNYVDIDFFIDPNEEQSIVRITTRPEYIASEEELDEENKLFDEYEEDDDDEEDDILNIIRKKQQEDDDHLSDDDIYNLI